MSEFAVCASINRELAARCLAELGNLTRLDMYRLLVRAGPPGLNITDIRTRLDVPASTLAFHLRGLVSAGLVAQEKNGRAVICRAEYHRMDAIIEFLREHCCEGFEGDLPGIAGAAIGPLPFAVSLDWTGSYAAVLTASSALSLACGAGAFPVKRPSPSAKTDCKSGRTP